MLTPVTRPAAPVNSIQYNDAGVFGGSSALTYDDTVGQVVVVGSDADEGALKLVSEGLNEFTGISFFDGTASPSANARNWKIDANRSVIGSFTLYRSTNSTGAPNTTVMTVDRLSAVQFAGVVTASSFAGNLTGNVTGNADTATLAATVTTNANLTGPITSVGNATAVVSQTGTGSTFVMAASPTMTGTPLAPTAAQGTSTTQLATTAFVVAEVAAAVSGLLDLKGSTDCSTNPNYPAASKGDAYYVTVAGRIGGASGKQVDIGDLYVASADNAGGTEAAVGTSWFVLEHSLVGALLAANNLSDLANADTAITNLGGAAYTGTGGLVREGSPTLTGTVLVSGNLNVAGIVSATSGGFIANAGGGNSYIQLQEDGSNTAADGPYIFFTNTAANLGWVVQMNAANGLDFWYGAPAQAVKATLSNTGGLTLGGTLNGNTITTGTGTLTLSTYTLTVAGTASVSGTNTGDQTSVSGNAGTVTVADAGGADCSVLLSTAATGNLSPRTDSNIGYNATTNTLTTVNIVASTSLSVTGTGSFTGMLTLSGTTALKLIAAEPFIWMVDTNNANTGIFFYVQGSTGAGGEINIRQGTDAGGGGDFLLKIARDTGSQVVGGGTQATLTQTWNMSSGDVTITYTPSTMDIGATSFVCGGLTASTRVICSGASPRFHLIDTTTANIGHILTTDAGVLAIGSANDASGAIDVTLLQITTSSQTFTFGSGAAATMTWNVILSGASDPSIVFGNASVSVGANAFTCGAFTATTGVFTSLVEVKAGASAGTIANVGGNIFDYNTDVSVGGAEADIYTSTTPASILATDKDKLIATYGGTFSVAGTEAAQLKVYFGGTAIWDSTAVVLATTMIAWRVSVEIIRVSSTVVRYIVALTTNGATTFVYAKAGELTGLTLSNTNVLKITGTSSGVGSGAGDIVGKMGYVRWDPAA